MSAAHDLEADGITLINNDTREKIAYTSDGESFTLHPQEMRSFPVEVARLFLAQCSHWVSEYTEQELPRKQNEAIVWIANMTGDPRLPKEVSRSVSRNGQDTTVMMPHPRREPQALSFWFKPDQIIEDAGDDSYLSETFDPVKIRVTIPPWTRKLVGESMSWFLLQRDGLTGDVAKRGAIVNCRAPSEYEPNVSWDLDKIRAYAHMVDSEFFSRSRLTSTWKQESAYANKLEASEARRQLLRAMHYWLCDSRVSLPNKAAFERNYVKLRENLGDIKSK
jgi:hypothetical protein